MVGGSLYSGAGQYSCAATQSVDD